MFQPAKRGLFSSEVRMRYLLLAVLLLSANAMAATAWDEDALTWSAPTACSDGDTNLAHCIITKYDVQTASSATGTWTTLASVTTTAYTAKALTEGQHCYRVVPYSSAGAGAAGPIGANSCQTTVKPQVPPGPPGAVVTVDTTAYELRGTPLQALRVGLVGLGVQCDSARQQVISSITYSGVPRSAVDVVNWPANKILNFYAKCG